MTTGAPSASSGTLPARSQCTSCAGTEIGGASRNATQRGVRPAQQGRTRPITRDVDAERQPLGPGPAVVARVQARGAVGTATATGRAAPGRGEGHLEVAAGHGARLVARGRPARDHPGAVPSGHGPRPAGRAAHAPGCRRAAPRSAPCTGLSQSWVSALRPGDGARSRPARCSPAHRAAAAPRRVRRRGRAPPRAVQASAHATGASRPCPRTQSRPSRRASTTARRRASTPSLR